MSGSEIDVAGSTKRAWKQFRRVLADRIERLGEAEPLLIEVEAPELEDEAAGCAPYVQVLWCGDELVAEVSSNTYLHASYRLGKASRGRLREIGWLRPADGRSENYQFWFDLEYVDKVADMATRALREVFGAVHPAFLVSDLDLDADPMLPRVEDSLVEEPLAMPAYDEDHLAGMIDAALAAMLGSPPKRDSDGDIPFVAGSAVVFVRLLLGEPTIRIFSEVAINVTDRDSAEFEIGVLNRDCSGVKFVLAGDRVVADVTLSAQPFVPDHLRNAVTGMCELIGRVDKDLAHRVGGQTFRGAAPAALGVPNAVLTLLDLEKEHPGLLTPKLVARACEFDPDVILAVVECAEPAPRRTQKVLRKALKIALA